MPKNLIDAPSIDSGAFTSAAKAHGAATAADTIVSDFIFMFLRESTYLYWNKSGTSTDRRRASFSSANRRAFSSVSGECLCRKARAYYASAKSAICSYCHRMREALYPAPSDRAVLLLMAELALKTASVSARCRTWSRRPACGIVWCGRRRRRSNPPLPSARRHRSRGRLPTAFC